jgi:hypothetical protein
LPPLLIDLLRGLVISNILRWSTSFAHARAVYSFEDFGRFLDRSSESRFNYLEHILGFWQSFCTINRAVPATGKSLADVKTMIYVIGVSYSTEYAIKGLYENTIGPVFEWIRGEVHTPQDEYARDVLQDYAAFLYTIPWYKYPFRGPRTFRRCRIRRPPLCRRRAAGAGCRTSRRMQRPPRRSH